MIYELYLDSEFVCNFELIDSEIAISNIDWSKASKLPGVDTGAMSISDFIADRIGNDSTRADVLLWYGISSGSIETFLKVTHLVSGFDKIHARCENEPEEFKWWSRVAFTREHELVRTSLF